MIFKGILLRFEERDYTPVPFNQLWISSILTNNLVGAYILLQDSKVIYVGRSDSCLKTRLLHHEYRTLASHVIFEILSTPLQAYNQECYWYKCYQTSSLLNKIEPAKPHLQKNKSPFLNKNNEMSLYCF